MKITHSKSLLSILGMVVGIALILPSALATAFLLHAGDRYLVNHYLETFLQQKKEGDPGGCIAAALLFDLPDSTMDSLLKGHVEYAVRRGNFIDYASRFPSAGI